MRRLSALVCALAVLVAAGAATPTRASAGSVDAQLAQTLTSRQAALRALEQIERRVASLSADLRRTQGQLDEAARAVLEAYRQRLALSAQLAEARELLNREAARAYEAGPTLPLQLLLGSRSPADLASLQEYTARVIGVNGETVARVEELRVAMDRATARLEARQAEVAETAQGLQALAAQAGDQLAAATRLATTMGLEVKRLQKKARDLAAAREASNASLAGLVDGERGADQSRLLALLGPSGGRGCEIPPGLRDTGGRMSGIASWYGWGFAGRTTASGAIYDPRLFTAANKELPLNSFLRVHYGSRCAIVLVNDRGPYIEGRVFDLSQGAAEYLGVGLNFVTADLLDVA